VILTERWRPKSFINVIGLNPKIPEMVGKDQPHFLFYGRAGTGKTTTAKIIIKELNANFLILNASDERGIDTIREKVKSFVSTKSTNEQIKIVFLDESDALTPPAQTSLRNLMETYSRNARFILCCNYVNKIIEPLQSRCACFEFKQNNSGAVLEYIKKIVSEENIQITETALIKLIENNLPDIRKIICKLQELKSLDRLIEIKDIEVENGVVKEIIGFINTNEFNKARQIALDNNCSCDDLLTSLYWEYRKQTPIPLKKLLLIGEAMKDLTFVISKEIGFECLLIKLMGQNV